MEIQKVLQIVVLFFHRNLQIKMCIDKETF